MPQDNSEGAAPVVILVDLPASPLWGASALSTSFGALDAPLLARVLPDLVVTPLFARGVDALQVAARLQDLGYRGRMQVVMPPLPNRRMVERELRAMVPALTIDFIEDRTP